VRIGARARLGERAVIVAHDLVELGDGALLGEWAAAADAAPTAGDVETPVRRQPLRVAPVVVGPGARVGPHAALGPGARVAAGAEVAPYAVLHATP
jgi:acetyltransferase-like isoleucine patch superfamily enzyme